MDRETGGFSKAATNSLFSWLTVSGSSAVLAEEDVLFGVLDELGRRGEQLGAGLTRELLSIWPRGNRETERRILLAGDGVSIFLAMEGGCVVQEKRGNRRVVLDGITESEWEVLFEELTGRVEEWDALGAVILSGETLSVVGEERFWRLVEGVPGVLWAGVSGKGDEGMTRRVGEVFVERISELGADVAMAQVLLAEHPELGLGELALCMKSLLALR